MAAKVLQLMPYNKLRDTFVNQATKEKQSTSKNRIIYDVKRKLDLEESDDLFRSIMDGFYK